MSWSYNDGRDDDQWIYLALFMAFGVAHRMTNPISWGRLWIMIGTALDHHLLRHALTDYKTALPKGNYHLPSVLSRNHLNGISNPESHGGKTHLGLRTPFKFLDHEELTRFGPGERHRQGAAFQAVGTYAVDLHLMLEHVKAIGCRKIYLLTLKGLVPEFENFAALDTDHVVVVKA